MAHGILEGISELTSVFPQLLQEAYKVGDFVLPNTDGFLKNPIETHEILVAAAHQKIDQVFDTDMADLYIPEAKVNGIRNNFVLGIIPLPSTLSGSFTLEKLLDAGKAIDRAKLTKAGRALVKHSYRPNSVFQRPVGNAEKINEQGQKILESILNHPDRTAVITNTKRLGDTVDIQAPGIGGVRYSLTGEMIGFLEP